MRGMIGMWRIRVGMREIGGGWGKSQWGSAYRSGSHEVSFQLSMFDVIGFSMTLIGFAFCKGYWKSTSSKAKMKWVNNKISYIRSLWLSQVLIHSWQFKSVLYADYINFLPILCICYYVRGRSRSVEASKIELFVAIALARKSSILDVAAALDPPLCVATMWCQYLMSDPHLPKIFFLFTSIEAL